MTKTEVRQLIRSRKAACSPEERAALSARIIEHLQVHPHWTTARTVLLYHSLPDEVNTHELITAAIAQGKRVLLPVVVGDELELRELPLQSSLHEGAFHILEPTGPLFTDYTAIDLAVIPGVAFTTDGRRLGRGRGYYDRFLSRLLNLPPLDLGRSTLGEPSTLHPHPSSLIPPLHTIGLAFPYQILDDLPTEPHDIRLNEVLTAT